MIYDRVFEFLKYITHWYYPYGDSRNTLIDTGSSNHVHLEFSPGLISFHRFSPDPPEVCEGYLGQPETKFLVKAYCCLPPDSEVDKPYIHSSLSYKTNGWWITKSSDINILIPGTLSYSPFGSKTRSRGTKPCELLPPLGSSIFSMSDWREFCEELFDYYSGKENAEIVGDPCLFYDFIGRSESGCITPILCSHPLQEECNEPGYYASLAIDFDRVIPWVKFTLPKQYDSPITAFLQNLLFILSRLGIDPGNFNLDIPTHVIDIIPLILVYDLKDGDSDDPCLVDYYYNTLQVLFRFCPCPSGYIYKDGECVLPCPDGYHWDPLSEACVTCGECSVWNGTECVSLSNCLEDKPSCPPGTSFNGTQCVPPPGSCPPGTRWNGSQCVDKDDDPPPPEGLPPCPEGTFWNGEWCEPYPEVICPEGYILVDGSCQPPPLGCPDGYYWNGEECIKKCPPGYHNAPSGCEPDDDQPSCPPGCWWSGSECLCGDDNPYPDSDPPPGNDIPRSDDKPPLPDPTPDRPSDLPPDPPPPAWPGENLCCMGVYWLETGGRNIYPGYLPGEIPNRSTYLVAYEKDAVPKPAFISNGYYYGPDGASYSRSTLNTTNGVHFFRVKDDSGNPIPPSPAAAFTDIYSGGYTFTRRRTQFNGWCTAFLSPPTNLMYCDPSRDVKRKGVWQIEAWFSVAVSGVGCIPIPIVGFMINKFLDTFAPTEDLARIWCYRHTVFGPAEEGSAAPYVDLTSHPGGKPTFRWLNEWVIIDLDVAPYVPCLNWGWTFMAQKATWRPYQ